jgi:type IV pilus assembly protein PilP
LAVTTILIPACGDDIGRSSGRGLGGPSGGGAEAAPGEDTEAETVEEEVLTAYSDDQFVETDFNRDPFRTYSTLLRVEVQETDIQRPVVMPTTAIEEMTLIAIISGVPRPKAMLKDSTGVGHIVERGMYLGRPQIVQASENVSMTLNWRVHRIRANEVVLTREDPTDPARPPLTRVIPLREEEVLASR